MRRKPDEAERLKELNRIVNWDDPGRADFMTIWETPRASRIWCAASVMRDDPAFLESPLIGFSYRPALRSSWWTDAESLGDTPLQDALSTISIEARSTRFGWFTQAIVPSVKIRLVANGSIEIHPLIAKPAPVAPLEFDIPREATRNGELLLSWYREQALGGNGRGCQVSEVWLIRK